MCGMATRSHGRASRCEQGIRLEPHLRFEGGWAEQKGSVKVSTTAAQPVALPPASVGFIQTNNGLPAFFALSMNAIVEADITLDRAAAAP
jgi:hypothetical protein